MNCLAFLLLRRGLALLLLSPLALLLLRFCLALLLLLLLNALALLLLRCRLVVVLHRRWGSYVAVGCQWLVNDHAGGPAMVDIGKLGPVGAGGALIFHLRSHGCGMLFTPRTKFRRSCPHLDATRSTIETDTGTAPEAATRTAVDVVHHVDIHIVVRAVVIEVAAAPVAALVAVANIAKAVVNAAVVADVQAPVSAIEPVTVVVEAPIARGPQSALVRSLDPPARHPVIAIRTPGPVAGSPEIIVAGSWGLVVVGQRRRRLGSIRYRLLAVTRIF